MNSASSIKFLYAAYTATWLIHVFYIGSLVRRYSRLRQQKKDLGKAQSGNLIQAQRAYTLENSTKYGGQSQGSSSAGGVAVAPPESFIPASNNSTFSNAVRLNVIAPGARP